MPEIMMMLSDTMEGYRQRLKNVDISDEERWYIRGRLDEARSLYRKIRERE